MSVIWTCDVVTPTAVKAQCENAAWYLDQANMSCADWIWMVAWGPSFVPRIGTCKLNVLYRHAREVECTQRGSIVCLLCSGCDPFPVRFYCNRRHSIVSSVPTFLLSTQPLRAMCPRVQLRFRPVASTPQIVAAARSIVSSMLEIASPTYRWNAPH